MFDNLFSNVEINNGRQIEFDIAKALAIIFMISIHVIMYIIPVSSMDTGVPWLFDTILGSIFAAPMFMFAMGLGLAYTRHNSPKDIINRGILILILAFALNFFRDFIMHLVAFFITNDSTYLSMALMGLMVGDILPFAGLAFILWGLLKKFKVSDRNILIMGIAFSIIGSIFNNIPMNNIVIGSFVGYFVGTSGKFISSFFPLLNWFIYPVIGYEFAKLIKRCKNKNKFYIKLIPFLLAYIIIYLFYINITHQILLNEFYHMSIFDVIFCLAVNIIFLGVYNYIAEYLPNKVVSFATELSKHITQIYVFSWLIICWVEIFLFQIVMNLDLNNSLIIFILIVVISLVSLLISQNYAKSEIKNKIKIL